MASSAPRTLSNDGVIEAAQAALGDLVVDTKDHVGEITLTVRREGVAEACRLLRDTPGLEYQQLMEIAGVDYPNKPERFEVNYHLLSLTRNRRIRVKVTTDERTPVPTVTTLWPVAGWLEREVFDLYGVTFAGNSDLRRILTDYGFEGHPLRKDFPLTGYVEMRYSETEKRVVYEPVELAQDFRAFDFLTTWNGPEYRLPGDEKAEPEAPGAPTAAPATGASLQVKAATATDKREDNKPYTTDQEDRKTAGVQEAQAEGRKSNEAKQAQVGGVKTDIDEPKPGNNDPASQGGPEAQ
jgi:NADH-quinone oxidoreductase subunit C